MAQKKSFKYFIGYSDNDFIGPLCIKLIYIYFFSYSIKMSSPKEIKNPD